MTRRFYRNPPVHIVAEERAAIRGRALHKLQLALDLPADLSLRPGEQLDLVIRVGLDIGLDPILQVYDLTITDRYGAKRHWEKKP